MTTQMEIQNHHQGQFSTFGSLDVKSSLDEIVILKNHPLQKEQRSKKSVKCTFCDHIHKRFECFKVLTCSNCGFSGCKKCVAMDRSFPSGQVGKVCNHCSKLPTQLEMQQKLQVAQKRKRKYFKNQRIQTISSETRPISTQTQEVPQKMRDVESAAVQTVATTTLFEDVQESSKARKRPKVTSQRVKELETHLEASLINEKNLVVRIGKISKENELLRASLQEKTKKVSEFLDALEESDSTQKTSERGVQLLEAENAELKLKNNELQERLEKHKLEMQNKENDKHSTREQDGILKQAKESAEKALADFQSKIEKFGGFQKIEQLVAEVDQVKEKNCSLLSGVLSASASPTSLLLQTNLIHQSIQNLIDKNTTLKEKTSHAAQENTTLQTQIETLTKNIDTSSENIKNQLHEGKNAVLTLKKEVTFQRNELESKEKKICELEFEKQMSIKYLNASHEVKLREMKSVLEREMVKFSRGREEKGMVERYQKESERERERVKALELQIKTLQTNNHTTIKTLETSKDKQILEFENLIARLQKNKQEFSEQVKTQMSRVLYELDAQKTQNNELQKKQIEFERRSHEHLEKQQNQNETLKNALTKNEEGEKIVERLQEELQILSTECKHHRHECLQRNLQIEQLYSEIGQRDQEIEKLKCHVMQAKETAKHESMRLNRSQVSANHMNVGLTSDPPGELRVMWKRLEMEEYNLMHPNAPKSELERYLTMLNIQWAKFTSDEKWDSLAREQKKLRESRLAN